MVFSCLHLRPYLLVGSYGHTSRVSESFRQGGAEALSLVLIQSTWYNPLTDDHDKCFVSGSTFLAYRIITVSASDICGISLT